MGDDFDDRFDCVVPVEKVVFLESGGIAVKEDAIIREGAIIAAGAGVKQAGATVKEGDFLLPSGKRLTASDLGVLAIGGHAKVKVFRKPVVAVIPTGSELIARGNKPERGQNIEANSVMLAGMLDDMGAEARCCQIISDDVEKMTEVLDRELTDADIVIVNGGSSKGGEDFATKLLRDRGTFLFHGVAAVPGRPLSISVADGKPIINLPGPPPAAFSVADWCMRAVVAHYYRRPAIKRSTIRAILTDAVDAPSRMAVTMRFSVKKSAGGTYEATPMKMRGGSLACMMAAAAVYISEIGHPGFIKGDEIELGLICSEEDL